ncbi:toxin-activating lysine-acyltransferase, partial [Pseudomonas shirazensis]
GERMWINDWVTPFGHSAALGRLLARRLMPERCARALHHRGEQQGFRVNTFHGIGVIPEQARAWFAAHPLATDA